MREDEYREFDAKASRAFSDHVLAKIVTPIILTGIGVASAYALFRQPNNFMTEQAMSLKTMAIDFVQPILPMLPFLVIGVGIAVAVIMAARAAEARAGIHTLGKRHYRELD